MKHEEIVIGTNKIIQQRNPETNKLEYRLVPVYYEVTESKSDNHQTQSQEMDVASSISLINLKLRAVTQLTNTFLELSDTRITYPLGNYAIVNDSKDILTVIEPNSGKVMLSYHKSVARKLQLFVVEEFTQETGHSVGVMDDSSIRVLLEVLYGSNTTLPNLNQEPIDRMAEAIYNNSKTIQKYLERERPGRERPNPANRYCGYLEHSYHFEGGTVYSSVDGVRVTSSIMDRELLLEKLGGSYERIRDLDCIVQEFEDLAGTNTIVIQVCRVLNGLSSATISTPDVRYVIHKINIGEDEYLALDSGGLRIVEIPLDSFGYFTIVRLVEYLTKPTGQSAISDKNASLITLFHSMLDKKD